MKLVTFMTQVEERGQGKKFLESFTLPGSWQAPNNAFGRWRAIPVSALKGRYDKSPQLVVARREAPERKCVAWALRRQNAPILPP